MSIKWAKKDVIAKVQEAIAGTGLGKPNILERLKQRAMGKPEVRPEIKV